MTLQIRKRGRPSKADIAAREQNQPKVRSDKQILDDLKERFDILSLLTRGTIAKNIRAMVVTGAPGVGKTYTTEQILADSGCQHEVVKGAISAINLYMLAYKYRKPGNVIVLDDSDEIFNDLDAVNILKALCDSGSSRKVSYLKEAIQLKENDIPQTFEFNGAMIFISNIDFTKFVSSNNKYAPHMNALMSRALYLDLQIHNKHSLAVWVNHMANDGRIFDIDDVPYDVRPKILQFISDHRDSLYELSIRTLKKLNQLVKTNPDQWEQMAKVLLCKVE